MNLPNIITLSRVPLLFIIGLLLNCEWQWAASLAFVLYVVGALTDILDGYLARKYGVVSAFGTLIDAVTDKVFVIGHFVVLLGFGMLPSWSVFVVIVILGREFLVTGLRSVAAVEGVALAASRRGKHKTFSQIWAIGSFIVYQIALRDVDGWLQPWMFDFVYYASVFALIVALYYTVYSGMEYVLEYRKYIKEGRG